VRGVPRPADIPRAMPAGSGFVVRILTVGSRLTFHDLGTRSPSTTNVSFTRQICLTAGLWLPRPSGSSLKGREALF